MKDDDLQCERCNASGASRRDEDRMGGLILCDECADSFFSDMSDAVMEEYFAEHGDEE